MLRSKKVSLVCVMMIAAGLILSGIGYLMGGRVWGIGLNAGGIWVNSPNVQGQNSYSYVRATEESEPFTGIDAELDFGDLTVEESDHFGISYCLREDCSYEVKVEDGVLRVVRESRPALGIQGDLVVVGIGSIGVFENEYVKIYIPAGAEFDSVRLVAESGSVSAENFRAKSLYAESDFGDVRLEGIRCEQAQIELESGELTLTDFGEGSLSVTDRFGKAEFARVTATESVITMESGNFKAADSGLGELTLEQKFGAVVLEQVTCGAATVTDESGKIELNGVTAETLHVKSGFGDVTGEDVSAQSAELVLESGACQMKGVDIPELTIQSDFGDVSLQLADAVTEYTLELDTDFGDVKVDQRDMGSTYRSLETKAKSLRVFCESGSIQIRGGEGA